MTILFMNLDRSPLLEERLPKQEFPIPEIKAKQLERMSLFVGGGASDSTRDRHGGGEEHPVTNDRGGGPAEAGNR